MLADRYLCIRSELSHLLNPQHVRRVASFLARRGVRRPHDIIQRNGIEAANAVALYIEGQELEGFCWQNGLETPGAWLHGEIRRASRELRLWRDS